MGSFASGLLYLQDSQLRPGGRFPECWRLSAQRSVAGLSYIFIVSDFDASELHVRSKRVQS